MVKIYVLVFGVRGLSTPFRSASLGKIATRWELRLSLSKDSDLESRLNALAGS